MDKRLPQEGVEALRYMANQLSRKTESISASHFQTVGQVLLAYDAIGVSSYEKGLPYIAKVIEVARRNLTTESILEGIVSGQSDLSPLMDVPRKKQEKVHLTMNVGGLTINGHHRPLPTYDWSTLNKDHSKRLTGLREIANAMYLNINVPFSQTDAYGQLREGAERLLNETKGDFATYKAILETTLDKLTPVQFARYVVSFFSENLSQDNVLRGIKALQALDQKYANERIGEFALDFVAEMEKKVAVIPGRRKPRFAQRLKTESRYVPFAKASAQLAS